MIRSQLQRRNGNFCQSDLDSKRCIHRTGINSCVTHRCGDGEWNEDAMFRVRSFHAKCGKIGDWKIQQGSRTRKLSRKSLP